MLNQILKFPQLWLSAFIGYLVRIELPFQLHTLIKKVFISYYKVNVKEAQFQLKEYNTLGDFFVRYLKTTARPLSNSKVISPVDGIWTSFGFLSKKFLLNQIKGKNYLFSDLVGRQYLERDFEKGVYCTIYLAPYHYHRVHSPIEGEVKSVTHIPGNLWPVNSWSVSKIDNLFTVNERIIIEIKDKQGATCLVVMIGATNVGKMTLSFCPEIQGNTYQKEVRYLTMKTPHKLKSGDELGCFHMGSTVILIFDKNYNKKHFSKLTENFQSLDVKMGETLEF